MISLLNFNIYIDYFCTLFCFQTGDLSKANASEDEKIMAMMSQSTMEYEPSRYVNFCY